MEINATWFINILKNKFGWSKPILTMVVVLEIGWGSSHMHGVVVMHQPITMHTKYRAWLLLGPYCAPEARHQTHNLTPWVLGLVVLRPMCCALDAFSPLFGPSLLVKAEHLTFWDFFSPDPKCQGTYLTSLYLIILLNVEKSLMVYHVYLSLIHV